MFELMTLSNHHPLTPTSSSIYTPLITLTIITISIHNFQTTHTSTLIPLSLYLSLTFTQFDTMQQAIPYRSWTPLSAHTPTTHFTITPHSLTPHTHTINTHNSSNCNSNSPQIENMVNKIVLENAVIVFARRECCMSHVVKRLLLGLGVNPAVHEVEEKDEVGVVRELERIVGENVSNDGKVQFPTVFIGGKLFGGLDRLMATHISGELVPILKEAGALWL